MTRTFIIGLQCLILSTAVSLYAQRGGAPQAPRPDNAKSLEHINAAKKLAADDSFLANPNNPTGMVTRRQDVDAFLRHLPSGVHVVIDEAYYHYVEKSSDYGSFVERVADDARLIVTRTFSKIYALAGLRVGYAIAAPETARLLQARLLGDGVSGVAATAAMTTQMFRRAVESTRSRSTQG